MKYLVLFCLLIVCVSAANTNKPANNKQRNKNGIQGRYDVPPGAEVPSNGDNTDDKSENLSLVSTPSSRADNDGSISSSINPFVDDDNNGSNTDGDTNKPTSDQDWISADPNQPKPQPNQPEPETNPQPNRPNEEINQPKPQPNQPDPQPNQPDPQPNQPDPQPNNDNDSDGDENCICVPYYQCQDGNIITDGSGLIDPRKKTNNKKEIPLGRGLKPSECKDSSNSYHVCCSEPERKPLDNYKHRCGIRNPNGINSRELSANEKGESQFGEWPYMATVLKVDESNSFFFQCGAVLISDQHVLTVAHCLSGLDPKSLVIRLGEWDTQSSNEFLPHVDYRVEDVKIHEKFVQSNLHNDVALITLSKRVKFEPHIDSVCLPKDEQFEGHDCVVIGWGKKSYREGSYSNIMKEVSLPLVGHDQCQEMLRKTRLGARFKLHNSFICAGGQEGKDSCKGDGGGPLLCYRQDGTYALAGLVAWGIDCGQNNVPGVYVNVKMFNDWIQQNSGKNIASLQGN